MVWASALSFAGLTMKTLSELRTLVRSPQWQSVDRTDQLVRSIQQSLRAEGYDVDADTVLRAMQQSRHLNRHRGDGRARLPLPHHRTGGSASGGSVS